jgi:hypothetical protein
VKTAKQIEGLEYDWLSLDEENYVALFSTGGSGYAPRAFLRNTEAHDAAIELILATAATTTAKFSPQLPTGLKNTWKLIAERGLFAFDCSPDGGPYRLVAAPTVATLFSDLPNDAKTVLKGARLPLLFSSVTTIASDFLSANDTTENHENT